MSLPSDAVPREHPLAEFQTINFHRLERGDEVEKRNLFRAAQHEGFFYLSFQDLPEVDRFDGIINGIYALEHHLFGLGEEQKMEFDVDKQGPMKLNGYKPIGRNVGGVGGKRDGFESWAIPKDGVLETGNVSFARPAIIDSQLGLLEVFMSYMQRFTTAIHSALSDGLELEPQRRLESFHRAEQSSPCILRLLKYHAQPVAERGAVQVPHTDLGSLTILFTSQPGLQVFPKGGSPDSWRFVWPKEGCAIVNIGDALSMMTGAVLHSSLHRVGPLPNLAMDTRFSFAYLQRPEEHTVLTTAGPAGEEITSGEWLRRKFGMLRKDTHKLDKQWILTGGQQGVIST
ncbi:hypothetical protein ACEQ8H_002748 [Pleosporales sp. CAS-2024a]